MAAKRHAESDLPAPRENRDRLGPQIDRRFPPTPVVRDDLDCRRPRLHTCLFFAKLLHISHRNGGEYSVLSEVATTEGDMKVRNCQTCQINHPHAPSDSLCQHGSFLGVSLIPHPVSRFAEFTSPCGHLAPPIRTKTSTPFRSESWERA